MIDVEYFDNSGFFVNAVNDAIGSAAGAVAASKRAEQWLSYPARPQGEGSFTELENGCRDGLRKPLGDGTARCGLKLDLVALGSHMPR